MSSRRPQLLILFLGLCILFFCVSFVVVTTKCITKAEFDPEHRGPVRPAPLRAPLLPQQLPLVQRATFDRREEDFASSAGPLAVAGSRPEPVWPGTCEFRRDVAANSPQVVDALKDRIFGSGRCRAPMDESTFGCLMMCAADEPDLHRSTRHLNIARYSISGLAGLCERKDATMLIWIKSGVLRVKMCMNRSKKSRTLHTVLRMAFMLACAVELPDVIFAFNLDDFPLTNSNRGRDLPELLTVRPALVQFVGTDTFPGLLWPTLMFMEKLVHPSLTFYDAEPPTWIDLPREVKHGPNDAKRWEDKRDVFLWRGSPTGGPYRESVWQFKPRPAMVELARALDSEERHVGGLSSSGHNTAVGFPARHHTTFDVAFVDYAMQTPPFESNEDPHASLKRFGKEYRVAKRVSSSSFENYKYLLHVDGHTASFGLSHKLLTNSLCIVHESARGFREHYYSLLEPNVHYVPLNTDLSNLRAIRDAVEVDDEGAKRIAYAGRQRVHERLRPWDTWCYVYRLIIALARQQAAVPTDSAMRDAGLNPHDFVEPAFLGKLREDLGRNAPPPRKVRCETK